MSASSKKDAPRIVVGVDGSPSSLAALRWAVRQARLSGGTVDAVYAWQIPAVMVGFGVAPIVMADFGYLEEAASKCLEAAIDEVTGPGDPPVRKRVVHDIPAQALLDAAADADLLVVGSRGHGGFADALLGSVSQHCVHHARCPVVVMRGEPDARPGSQTNPGKKVLASQADCP